MTSSENPQNDDFINWRSEYFQLFHEYDILVDKYVERGRRIQELMGGDRSARIRRRRGMTIISEIPRPLFYLKSLQKCGDFFY